MKHLEKGMRVWVKLAGKKTAGIVQDTAFSNNGDYMQCKVELLIINPLAPGQLLRQVYPHPIQSYKLTRRYEVLAGEEAAQEEPGDHRISSTTYEREAL